MKPTAPRRVNWKPSLYLKLVRATLRAICPLLLLAQHRSYAQISLTGLLQQGTYESGQTGGSPIWNTLGDEVSYANLYVTQPNAGYSASFLNHGNDAAASISYVLTPGTYEFFFFGVPFAAPAGRYGLNLFFDGDNNNPGIAAYSAAGVSTANAVPAGLYTLSLNGLNSSQVPAPGTLAYTADGVSVALTAYGFGLPGVFGGPAVDRVGNLNDAPDGQPDGVGVVDLTVVAVPEPSTLAIILIVGLLLCPPKVMKMMRNHAEHAT